MSARELSAEIGKRYVITDGSRAGLAYAVQVLDARQLWGRVDLLVRPITGSGESWVSLDLCREYTDA